MKTSFVVVSGMAAGLALGLGLAWIGFSHGAWRGLFSAALPAAERPPVAEGLAPIASIADVAFDFGDVDLGHAVDHHFRVTNDGAGPLLLHKGGTSCGKCTLSELPRESLAPGESERIRVAFQSHDPGSFRHTATILTNDPARPRIELVIRGVVIAPLRATPSDIVFTRLAPDEPATAETRLLAYGPAPLEITGHEFLEPETAGRFRVELTPLPPAVAAAAGARSGVSVKVTALPGLPVGSVRQTLRLSTNQPRSPEIDVPIQGAVETDLTIAGAGWDRDGGVLSLGAVSRQEGARREIFVLARGAHRHEIRLAAGERSPPWIQVEIGAPEILQSGVVVRWPVSVVIPPGSPEVNCLGTTQGKLGELFLDAAPPDGTRMKLGLRFLVRE